MRRIDQAEILARLESVRPELTSIAEAPRDYLDKKTYKACDSFGQVFECQNPHSHLVEITFHSGDQRLYPQNQAPVFDAKTMKSQTIVRTLPRKIESEITPKKYAKKNKEVKF